MIVIIDYGMGNLASVYNAFTKLGFRAITSNHPEEIANAGKIVLPGVGAFSEAMNNLINLELDEAIKMAIGKGTPFLGICLGLQMLFGESEENGLSKGLGIIEGKVHKFSLPFQYKIPHMGWNNITVLKDSRIFKGIPSNSYFYFVHSYYAAPLKDNCIAAVSNYGIDFTCAIEVENVFATQFHPEKSGAIGLKVLKNFGEMSR
ncbi:MAG: imidazole glycerol phosphate synthase subunit HisH [Syntrophomonadaceae bacterium]